MDTFSSIFQINAHGMCSVFHKNNWFQGRAIAAERKHPLCESLRYWPSPNVLKYWLEYWSARLCNNLSIFVNNKILIVETGKKRGKEKHKKRSRPSVYIERSDNPCIQSTRDEYLRSLFTEGGKNYCSRIQSYLNEYLLVFTNGRKGFDFSLNPATTISRKKVPKVLSFWDPWCYGSKGFRTSVRNRW